MRHQLQRLRHHFVVNAPVRQVLSLFLTRQQRLQTREKAERRRAAIQYIRQAQIVGLFVQMAIVIADKADAAGAQCLRLTVKHVNARTLFHQHYFMKIMVMFRKCRLWHARFNGDRVIAGREEISTV